MIERFAVSNYKSIRNRVEIFFIEGFSRMKSNHISDDGCLRITSIFGANASGKSNLIKGLKFIKRLITDPYYRTKYPACYWGSEDNISKFEIDFTIKNEMGGYDTYNYLLDVATIEKRTENKSKQYYEYEVVGENLAVTNEFGEKTEIIDKRSKSKTSILSDIQMVIEEEQEKLISYQSRSALINKQMNLAENKLADMDVEYPFVLKVCKIMSMMAAPDVIIGERVNNLIELYGNDWKSILSATARDIWYRKRRFRNALVHEPDNYQQNIGSDGIPKSRNIYRNNDKETPFLEELLDSIPKEKLKEYIYPIIKKMHPAKGFEGPAPPIVSNLSTKVDQELFFLSFTRLMQMDALKKRIIGSVYQNKNDLMSFNDLIRQTVETIEMKRSLLTIEKDMDHKSLPVLYTKKYEDCLSKEVNKKKIDDKTVGLIVDKAFRWFVSTLFILETDDYYLPINEPNLLENLSNALSSLDVGIDGLGWKKTYCNDEAVNSDVKEIDLIKSKLSQKDWERLDRCQKNSINSSCSTSLIIKTDTELNLFTYYMGEESVKKLVTYHNRNHDNYTNIMSESDGTRRLIELASILLPTSSEKVFIVDELDRRLHPMLTHRFIELFLGDENRNKQLIFTTHESRLLTTEIFRPDEIWFMSMKDNTSSVDSLDEIMKNNPKMFSRRTDKLYLEDLKLPGVPKIEKPI